MTDVTQMTCPVCGKPVVVNLMLVYNHGAASCLHDYVQDDLAPQLSVLRDADGHWGDLILAARDEAERAMIKFPQPNYVISKIAEEAGEVVKAAIHCAEGRETAANLRGEMRQLIAMLFRLWVEGDQVHGLPPVSAVLHHGKGGAA